MKKLTRKIDWNYGGHIAFLCPKCKMARDFYFQANVILNNAFEDDIIPDVIFKMDCGYCGNKFKVSVDDAIDADIADEISVLERKGYIVEDSFNDDYTFIAFKYNLPKEVVEMLDDSDWDVSNYVNTGGSAILNDNQDMNKRIESLTLLVDKLPERWKICPPGEDKI